MPASSLPGVADEVLRKLDILVNNNVGIMRRVLVTALTGDGARIAQPKYRKCPVAMFQELMHSIVPNTAFGLRNSHAHPNCETYPRNAEMLAGVRSRCKAWELYARWR